jgi:hypothetical protein
VNSNGDNRSKEHSSLRKKIHIHKTSISHKACESIKAEHKKVLLETVVDNMNAKHVETTIRVFRTMYTIAKQNRPFTDLPVVIELQELNGLNMGRVLHSNFSCANIVDHISKEMMNKIAQYIIEHNIKISVMVDESTTVSRKSVLVIRLRCTLNEDDPPLSFFWDLVELENTTAAGIKNSCLS